MKSACIVVLMLVSTSVFAAQKIPGKIIYADRTVDVTFLISTGIFGDVSMVSLQDRIRYVDGKGKKKWLRPTEAEGVVINFEGESVTMLTRSFTGLFGEQRYFIHLLKDGPVQLFEFYSSTYMAGGPNMAGHTTVTVTLYLQRGGDKLTSPNALGFRKEMADYFKDCPKLVDLISNKDFKRRDLEEIVDYYNRQCVGQ